MINMKPVILFALLSAGVCFFSSCKKDAPQYTAPAPPVGPAPPVTAPTGVYVLATDDFHAMTSLAYFNFATKTLGPDVFSTVNGNKFGYGVLDMIVYGNKIYLADNGANYHTSPTPTIDVLDAGTGKLLKQITYTAKSRPSGQPSQGGTLLRFTTYNGSVYVSSSNGTIAEIDTVGLAISRNAQVSAFPIGGMAVANGQIYCALEDIESDSIAVVDIATLTLKGRLKVMDEPANMVADPSGNVYAISIDDDDAFNIPHMHPDTLGLPDNPSFGGYALINSQTNAVTSLTQTHIDFTPYAAFFQDSLFYVADNAVHILNTRTQTLVNPGFITVSERVNMTDMNVNPFTSEVLLSICGIDESTSNFKYLPATVTVYDAHGQQEYSFQPKLSTVIKTAFR
jgi:hypothetical protein